MAEGKRTWGYRVVAHPDGDDIDYGLHEVSYEDGMPIGTSVQPLLVSQRRDFSDVIAQISEAARRPLHDPENPVLAPRSNLSGKAPTPLLTPLIPLTMPEIIQYHRNYADDIALALDTREELASGDLRDYALMDQHFALRIIKSLESMQDLDKVRQQLAGYLDQARALAQGIESADLPPVIDQIDAHLENAQGLLGMIYNLPGPDNCQVCYGAEGGMPGNENVVDGVVMCDYCSVDADRAKRGAS